MTIKLTIGRTTTPELFYMFVRCVGWVKEQYNAPERTELCKIIKELYNVDISEMKKFDNGTVVHDIEFESEYAYTMFILRWA